MANTSILCAKCKAEIPLAKESPPVHCPEILQKPVLTVRYVSDELNQYNLSEAKTAQVSFAYCRDYIGPDYLALRWEDGTRVCFTVHRKTDAEKTYRVVLDPVKRGVNGVEMVGRVEGNAFTVSGPHLYLLIEAKEK